MMYQVVTLSGSVYQVDTDAKRVRRCAGVRAPTPRQGADWRDFASAAAAVGLPMVVAWAADDRGPKAAPGCTPGTVTSMVVSITPHPDGGCIQSVAVARSPGAHI